MPRRRAASMRLVPASTSISVPSMVSFGIASLGGGLGGPLRCLPQEFDCAGKAGARTAIPHGRASRPAQGFELGAELFDVGDVGPDGAVVERADGGAAAALGHVENGVEVVLAAVALDDAMHHLFDPAGGLAAWRALAARLVRVEARQDRQRLRDRHALVHHYHAG